MIREGDTFPAVALKLVGPNAEITDVDTGDLVASGVSVVFSIPGAFTPTCSNNHLPGFVATAAQFAKLGVDRILCATVNDHHVVGAWAETQQALDDIGFLADAHGELARQTGLTKLHAALGERFVRAALIIRDGVVQHLFIDDVPGQVTSSGALAVMEAIKADKPARAG